MTTRSLQYVYGKDITRTFYPLEGSEPLKLPTQTITAYLFDTKPNKTQGEAGTGAIDTAEQVSQSGLSPFQIVYKFDAIERESYDSPRVFWEAINLVTQEAGETQTIIRSFKVSELEQLDSAPEIRIKDIKSAFPAINNYLADGEIQAFVDLAQEELKLYFLSRGIKWERIYDQHELKLVIAYKAISDAAFSQIMTQNDRHHLRHQQFGKKYEDLFSLVKVKYDRTNAGQPTAERSAAVGYITARR